MTHVGRILLAFALVTTVIAANPGTASAQGPSEADTARLLGYLWADGSKSGDVWDATTPDGARWLIEELVERHGGTWVDRFQLMFTLPDPWNWDDWTDSLPDDDQWTRDAVRNPHFLAAMLEGEGEIDGHVYDQDSCCTAGFTRGRMTQLVDLLQERGYESARLDQTSNTDSGVVRISGVDIAELRSQLRFVCPSSNDIITVPGGADWATHGPLRWLGDETRWANRVRTDCPTGAAIPPPQAPNGNCYREIRDGALVVRWTVTRGNVNIVRDGQTLATVSALDERWSRPDGLERDWRIRVRDGALSRVIVCTNPPAPPPVGATCRGRTVTIFGTSGNDVILGTDGDDVIDAGAGADRIEGRAGNDIICAGPGADVVFGGDGRDVIRGGRGDDIVRGGEGRDRITGGAGDDELFGESANDRLFGDSGDDILDGGGGRDRLKGLAGNDRLFGGRSADICIGGPGRNVVAASCESLSE